MTRKRCHWVNLENPLYVRYHDEEWGVPVHEDRKLFEMLCLEGAQAGLSWETVLNKREGYRSLFLGFDPEKCARLSDQALEKIVLSPLIVRNRLKVWSVRANARAMLAIAQEQGSFDAYLSRFCSATEPALMGKELSKDLKRRGFKFVGGTICYAFMQAVGMVNDHEAGCFRRKII